MILFYSDLHLRPERLADCEAVLTEILRVAKAMRDDGHEVTIVNGGDTFNTRGVIKTSCFDVLQKHYREWAAEGFKQIILVGNHDQEDREGEIHPMRVFGEFAEVVDKPLYFPGLNLMAFPYLPVEKIKEAISEAPKGAYAVAHWGVRGAMRNAGNVDTDGVPVEWLTKFRRVFCGHYHYRNSFANVQYIGSPMQQNFGEMGQEKGILLFDYEDGLEKLSFVELKDPPRHYEAQIHWVDGKEEFKKPSDIRPKDFVRVRVYGDSELCSSIDQSYVARKIKCNNVKLEREITDKSYSRMDIKRADIVSPTALAEKYVDFVTTELDKKRLLAVGKEIMG